jgi:hypothetical protein
MRKPLLLLLLVSLAFNLAVAAAVGARLLTADGAVNRADQAACGDVIPYGDSPQVRASCSRMHCRLEALRQRQGEETRRLAELLAAPQPDREEIDRCVVGLGDLQLGIQRLVVDTVLEQMATLPPDARGKFCEHVRGRLCAPWSGCGMLAPQEQHAVQTEPQQQGGRD